MTWHVAGKLKSSCVVEGPDQLLGCPWLDQHAIRVVVFHSNHLHASHAMAHVAPHFSSSGGCKRSILEHARHFFLVRRVSSGLADIELVQQRPFVVKYKANRFTGLYVDAFSFEENITHLYINRASDL